MRELGVRCANEASGARTCVRCANLRQVRELAATCANLPFPVLFPSLASTLEDEDKEKEGEKGADLPASMDRKVRQGGSFTRGST